MFAETKRKRAEPGELLDRLDRQSAPRDIEEALALLDPGHGASSERWSTAAALDRLQEAGAALDKALADFEAEDGRRAVGVRGATAVESPEDVDAAFDRMFESLGGPAVATTTNPGYAELELGEDLGAAVDRAVDPDHRPTELNFESTLEPPPTLSGQVPTASMRVAASVLPAESRIHCLKAVIRESCTRLWKAAEAL